MSLSVSGLSERRGTAWVEGLNETLGFRIKSPNLTYWHWCRLPLDLSSEECEQRDGQESSTQLWPRSPSLKEPPGSPASVSAASLIHNLYESKKNVSSSKIVPQEQKGMNNSPQLSVRLTELVFHQQVLVLFPGDSFNNQQSNTESRSEGVYDVLPLRNRMSCYLFKLSSHTNSSLCILATTQTLG